MGKGRKNWQNQSPLGASASVFFLDSFFFRLHLSMMNSCTVARYTGKGKDSSNSDAIYGTDTSFQVSAVTNFTVVKCAPGPAQVSFSMAN